MLVLRIGGTLMFEETKKYINALTIGYIIALSIIAALSVSSHFFLYKVIKVQSCFASLINVSGKQRMLSQRIGMLSCHYALNQNDYNKKSLSQAISSMESAHLALTKGDKTLDFPSTLPPEIYDVYYGKKYDLDHKVKEYIALAKQFLYNPTDKELLKEIMSKSHDSLLEGLDKIVRLYETQSIEQIEMITYTQRIVLIVIIATLFVEALFIFRPIIKKIKYFATLLYELATHDYLTKFANRRLTLELLEKLLIRNRIDKQPISVMMVDIDFFKKINDAYGHNAGDSVIVAVAKTILKSVRPTDICGRWGGEEFLIILPETDLKDADAVAQRVLLNIEKEDIDIESKKIKTTVSIGVSTYIAGEPVMDFIERADSALYLAKNNGRNRVESRVEEESLSTLFHKEG
ncbi:diguanylate cyclase [Sulfurimonas sp. HSL-1716]|uniref:diguanylate cyclase n=1 Tax=Hydrocurvibacter sulfurireducens TaxID=3131937 RepID=UPI0031F8A329